VERGILLRAMAISPIRRTSDDDYRPQSRQDGHERLFGAGSAHPARKRGDKIARRIACFVRRAFATIDGKPPIQ
jgi:hypothetical protein